MEIRKIRDEDYPEVVELLKLFFAEHSIFGKTENEIISYLMNLNLKNELYVLHDVKIRGFSAIVTRSEDTGTRHTLVNFKHFVYESEDIAQELLTFLESELKNLNTTVKIELNIAENEKSLDIFLRNDYLIEARLLNHYRWGETTFIVSKSYDIS